MIPETRDELIEMLNTGAALDEISFNKLNRIILYEPDEMIVMCEPGLTLASLDEELKKNHQWIASLLPDEREEQTLSDALSWNAYHPRTKYSSPLATSMLGGTFVTFKGEVFKSGSRVVKSVAGYDTHRAFVGSEDKLFLPIEFTLKVMPRPKEFIRFTASIDTKTELLKRRPLILEEWDGQLVVEFAGEPEDIADDRAWLNQYRFIEREFGDDWSQTMLTISYQRTLEQQAKSMGPSVQALLNQLRDQINV